MKKRIGFVSNSSAASFVVWCSEKPNSELLLKKLQIEKSGSKENREKYKKYKTIAQFLVDGLYKPSSKNYKEISKKIKPTKYSDNNKYKYFENNFWTWDIPYDDTIYLSEFSHEDNDIKFFIDEFFIDEY